MAAKAKPSVKRKSTVSQPAQGITPYLYYTDVDAALDWLSKTFRFKPMMKFAGPDGKTNHSSMKLANGEVFMLGCPGPTNFIIGLKRNVFESQSRAASTSV